MKRFLWGLAVLVFVTAAVGYAFRGRIAIRLMEKVLASNLRTNLVRELPDGLHLVLCGAGSPLPDPKRSGPCAAVVAGERLYIVDAGSGASRSMSRLRIPQGEIDAVLLTHFHSDHIDGLGELLLQRWANAAASTPTPIYGPQGVEEIVKGFAIAYGPDSSYRVAHHGEQVMPPNGAGAIALPFVAPADGKAQVVLADGDLTITAFRVSHEPVEPAVGYRFDYKGRSVVLSGDTSKSTNLQRFADGADLLVHEALAPQLVAIITEQARAVGRDNIVAITQDILDYHTTPVEAAEIAQAARVKHLLFYHIVPPLPLAPLEELFVEGVGDAYDGPVSVGRDGTLVTLAAGSGTIEVRQLP